VGHAVIAKRLAVWAALSLAALRSPPVLADAGADLERGLARFEAGEFAAAIGPLEAAHAADPSDLDTDLLLGIAYYRCDDPRRARPLLAIAEHSPDPETRDSARIFLGLLADAAGDATRALGYYDSVARGSSSLATSGRELLDRGRVERFTAALVIRPELDSNVPLLPATATPTGGDTGDRDLFVLALLRVRPLDTVAVVLDATVAYRKQMQLTDYDLASSVAGATWSHLGTAYRAALGYHLDASMLGGVGYQLGHTVDAGARRAIAGSFGVAASYQLVVRTLYPDAFAGYTGTVQTGVAQLSWLAPTWELELGGVIAREATDDPALSAVVSGGQLAGRLRLGRADLRLFARALDRRYDDAAQGRQDVQLRADASVYVDLTPHLGAVLGGTLLDNRSNVMDDGFVKWTGYLGVVVATAP
jgi:tetratricopeptide (TPR) repeat protein